MPSLSRLSIRAHKKASRGFSFEAKATELLSKLLFLNDYGELW
jgi:hypothetical protein